MQRDGAQIVSANVQLGQPHCNVGWARAKEPVAHAAARAWARRQTCGTNAGRRRRDRSVILRPYGNGCLDQTWRCRSALTHSFRIAILRSPAPGAYGIGTRSVIWSLGDDVDELKLHGRTQTQELIWQTARSGAEPRAASTANRLSIRAWHR